MFNSIIGNEEAKNILVNAIKTNTISHSYIFSGVNGIGKMLIAKEFAKAILCFNKNNAPCNTCKACESFDNSNNPDITIIDENEETIKNEQIKNLVNNVLEKPIQSDKKIYIINNSENMTKEAQNSLLKTLEEPPQYVVIILITSNENKLLNTIKSRCLKISFRELNDNEIKKYFDNISEKIPENMFKVFGGSIGNALRLRNKSELYENIFKCINNIESMNELQIIKMKDELFQDKEEIQGVLEYINTLFYEKLVNNLEKTEFYSNCIKIIENTKIKIKNNSNYDMTIDSFLLSIWEEIEKNG